MVCFDQRKPAHPPFGTKAGKLSFQPSPHSGRLQRPGPAANGAQRWPVRGKNPRNGNDGLRVFDQHVFHNGFDVAQVPAQKWRQPGERPVLNTSESLDREGLENPTISHPRVGPVVEAPFDRPLATAPTARNGYLSSLNLFAIPLAIFVLFSQAYRGSFLGVDNPKWQIHSKGARFVLVPFVLKSAGQRV
jgi:hypothetical protein